MNERLHEALRYKQKGWSVIPLGNNKRPCIKSWKEFQTRAPSEDEVRRWWSDMPDANVGIVTGMLSGLTVVDMDTEEGEEEVHKRIPHELLPSQVKTPKGRHYYFKYDSRIRNGVRLLPGTDIRSEGGYVVAPPSANRKGRWEWIWEDEPFPMPETLAMALIEPKIVIPSQTTDHAYLDLNQGKRNNSLFHVATCLARGNMLEADIRTVLESLGRDCDPPFLGRELEAAIKSAIERQDDRKSNLTGMIRDWVEQGTGGFWVKDLMQELGIRDQEQRRHVYVILKRLEQEGKVESTSKGKGHYCIPDTNAPLIDFITATGDELPLVWPLDIGSVYRCLPKTITVVAGEMNVGKTAFLLRFCRDNFHQPQKLNYLCSEMGPDELKDRLEKFGEGLNIWANSNFLAREREDSFHEVIMPDDINLIDYMEIDGSEGRQFWRVGGLLKDIRDRLNKGIAIVAIQKNPKYRKDSSHSLGLGGYRGMEKPRLYLTLSGGNWAKIEKCKQFYEENPTGKSMKFGLRDGCKFSTQGVWHRRDYGEY